MDQKYKRLREIAESYVNQLRSETCGKTIYEEYGIDESNNVTLIVESDTPHKEVVEDLGLTIIYQNSLTADSFRGRVLCGAILCTALTEDASYDALRNSLRICKLNEIPLIISL